MGSYVLCRCRAIEMSRSSVISDIVSINLAEEKIDCRARFKNSAGNANHGENLAGVAPKLQFNIRADHCPDHLSIRC